MSQRNSTVARWAALGLMAGGLAMAQPQQQAPAAGNGSISGTVTNSVTGAPLPRAHVEVFFLLTNSSQMFSATTDDQGKFAITALPAGRFILNVQRTGFVTPPNGNRLADTQLRPDEKKENLKFALTPTGGISGRVLDSGGGPIQGAIVSLEGAPYGINPSTTDEKGQFRISSVPLGRYRVVANPAVMPFPPEIRTDGTHEVHYARTYYPDVLADKDAQRVEVGAGAEVMGIDIHLVRTPVVTVSGKVSDMPSGAATIVRAQSIAVPAVQGNGRVRSDGSFQIWQLDPGEYWIVAIATSQGVQRRMQSIPVVVRIADTDIENLALRIIPPFDVVCRLAYADAKARELPVPQGRAPQTAPAGVSSGGPPPQLARRLSIRPDGPVFGDPSPTMFAAIDLGADDSFTVAALQPGRYRFMSLWGAYIKSVTVGEKETEGDVLDVSAGPVGAVTVTVGAVTGELSGVVSDSSGPTAGVRIVIRADRNDSLPMVAVSGADGKYRFPAVPPGRYKVLAADNDLVTQFQVTKNLSEFANIADSVDIAGDDKVTKALIKQLSNGK